MRLRSSPYRGCKVLRRVGTFEALRQRVAPEEASASQRVQPDMHRDAHEVRSTTTAVP
jgi:hypothetical protein